MKRLIYKCGLILIFSVFAISTAHAHKVTIFAWAEGDRIYTESKFSGGKKVKNGKVAVFDNKNRQLLEGLTDDHGRFSFTVPATGDLNIVLNAGMGHQNAWKLSAADLGGEQSSDPGAPLPSPSVAPGAHKKDFPRGDTPGLTVQAIEAIVARQLEQKLQPLTRMMAAAKETGPTASDIFGGIGYIFGLVGLGTYLRYRRDGRRP